MWGPEQSLSFSVSISLLFSAKTEENRERAVGVLWEGKIIDVGERREVGLSLEQGHWLVTEGELSPQASQGYRRWVFSSVLREPEARPSAERIGRSWRFEDRPVNTLFVG